MSSGDDHLLTTIQEHYTMAGQLISLTKKQGVSGKNAQWLALVPDPPLYTLDLLTPDLFKIMLSKGGSLWKL